MVAGNKGTSPSWVRMLKASRTFSPARQGESVDRAVGATQVIANPPPTYAPQGRRPLRVGARRPRGDLASLPYPLPWRLWDAAEWGAVLTLLGPADHMEIEVTPPQPGWGVIRDV